MIFWTLSSCVLLALSPAVLAEKMGITADCSTDQPDTPDLPTIQDAIIDLYTHIPVIGDFIGMAKDAVDIFGAFGNHDSQFGKQWENCIKGWIDEKIAKKSHKEILAQLNIMATKMNRTIVPSIQDEYISLYDFNEINRDLHDLRNAADQIKTKIAGVEKDPQEFIFAFNSAISMDLLATKLFTQKLNETIFDPRYKSLVLQNIGVHLVQRMNEYGGEINSLEEELKDFKDGDWGIKIEKSGHCHDNWGGFNWNDYTCHIADPHHRTGKDAKCASCPDGWFFCDTDRVCPSSCNYAWCDGKLAEKRAARDKVQKNIKELIKRMKTAVGTANKYFEELAHPKTMELTEGTYCNSGCRNSEYHESCVKDCRLVPNEG